MPNIIDILARALSLRQETALNSITPNRAGGIMYDTLLVLNQMQLEGGSLLISKVYASVSAMEADTTPTSDLTGRALKPGQLVVIVTSDSSSSDMGSEYRFNGPGSWTYVGKVGGLPLDTVPTQSSTKGITSGGVYTALAAMKAEGYKYMGLATPGSGGTAPGTPNQPVFYIAGPGSYPNFGSITVASGYLGFIKYSSGSWTVESVAVGKDYDEQISELDGQISQLEAKVDGFENTEYTDQALTADKYFNTSNDPMPAGPANGTGTYCARILVTPGEKYRIVGLGGSNQYARLWTTADADRKQVRHSENNYDARTNPVEITINEGEANLYINLSSYDAQIDKVQKVTTTQVPGLEQRVTALEGETIPEVTDETGTSSDLAASQKLVTEIKDETDSSIANIEEAIEGTSQEEYLPVEMSLESDKYYNTTNDPMPAGPAPGAGTSCARIVVTPGEKYKIYGLGGNKYANLYVLTDSSRNQTRTSGADVNTRETPAEITIAEGEYYLYLDFVSYDSQTDKLEKSTIVTTPGLDGRITNLETRVGALENEEGIAVCIPDVIYAVAGDTLQLYYRSIFRCVDFSKYAVHLDCNIGAQYPRYYEVTPTASQIGDHPLEVTIKDNNNNVLGTKTITLSVKGVVSSPATEVNVLCVGASGTAGGQWASECKRRLVGIGGTPAGSELVNINFVGSKDVTFDGKQVKVEATGGYSFPSYTSVSERSHSFTFTQAKPFGNANVGDVYSFDGHNFTIKEINITDGVGNISCSSDYAGSIESSGGTLTKVSGEGSATMEFASCRSYGNPFVYDGQIDIQQYADDYCNPQEAEHGRIDIVFTELFGNGTPPYETNPEIRLAQMQAFIDQFRAVFPNCKFCIGLMWNPDIRGGMGVNYGATGNWHDAYAIKYSAMGMCNALQKYITDNNLSDYVFILNWLNEFDEENDFRQTTKPVNTRSSVTEIFGVNGVHPATVGYNQMADTAWRLFVAKFCQS